MGYVVVVFAFLNALAWVGAAYVLWRLRWDTEEWVRTAIGDEVRRQDDRIEKRLARPPRAAEDDGAGDQVGGMVPGRAYRRR